MKPLYFITFVLFIFNLNYLSNTYAQTYNMSTQTVTDCQGTLYDSGGSSGEYGNNENATFSICPTPVPTCFNLQIDTIHLEENKDKLILFSGADINGAPIDTFSGQLNSFGRQVEGECLTFQFTSDINETASGWKLSWNCFTDECTPLPPLPQDCISSVPICQNQYSPTIIASGNGNIPNEINGDISCLNSGEKNNVWYTFTVLEDGLLNFSIVPNVDTDDYDWSVYNLTNHECSDIFTNEALEVSCNYSPAQGITGANNLAGNQNEPEIPVQAGETYVINVSQFSPSIDGYTIDFEPSTATIFDDKKPSLTAIETPSECATDTLRLLMSENVLCTFLDKDDFALFDEEGDRYTITDLRSPACDLGAEYDRFFTLTVSPAFVKGGQYSLLITEELLDLCGNVTDYEQDTIKFDLNFSNTFTGTVEDVFLCNDGTPNIQITGNDTYNIYDGNGVAPENFLSSGNSYDPSPLQKDSVYTFYVTQINNNCESAPVSVQVLISTGDVAAFDMPNSICPVANEEFIPTTLSSTSTPGGTFSISPSASIDENTGDITLSSLTPNETYTITYTSPAESSDCQEVANHNFTLEAAEAVSITGIQNEYCEEDETVALALSPTNGTLVGAGTDATALTFSPRLAGTGTHTLTYTYDNNNCEAIATFDVTVLPSPNVELLAPSNVGLGETAEIVFTGSTTEIGTTFDWDFQNGISSSDVNSSAPQKVVWNEEGMQLITLTIVQANGCSAEQSISIEVFAQNTIQLPTAFSPNEDGINDEFNMIGQNIQTATIAIYNRWGKQIFIDADFINNGWNGLQNDFRKADMGTYFYIIEVTYLDGVQETVKGNVMIIW